MRASLDRFDNSPDRLCDGRDMDKAEEHAVGLVKGSRCTHEGFHSLKEFFDTTTGIRGTPDPDQRARLPAIRLGGIMTAIPTF